MEVLVKVPDDIVEKLEARWADLSRHALEGLAAEAYREGILSGSEVQRMLGLATRWEADALLKRAGAFLDYTPDDLREDLSTFRSLTAG